MTAADPARVAVVVLAAGGSRRLGQPKQLVLFRGVPLLRHAARTALDSGVGPVLAVLGAEAERCGAALAGLAVRTVPHPAWDEGMGSSLRVGVAAAASDPAIGAVILMTCDQPGVTSADLARLAFMHRTTGAAVVASHYAGAPGIPVLFARSRFGDLARLGGDEGARSLVAAEGDGLVTVPCPAAEYDIDSAADLGSPD